MFVMSFTQTHLRSLPSTDRERTAVLLQLQSFVRVPKIIPEEIINSRTSRYSTDFKEKNTLGKGGFGKVYKVGFNGKKNTDTGLHYYY